MNSTCIAAALWAKMYSTHAEELGQRREKEPATLRSVQVEIHYPPVVRLPTWEELYSISIDACDRRVKCALLPKQDDKVCRPIWYRSKIIKSGKRNLYAIHRESLPSVVQSYSYIHNECLENPIFEPSNMLSGIFSTSGIPLVRSQYILSVLWNRTLASLTETTANTKLLNSYQDHLRRKWMILTLAVMLQPWLPLHVCIGISVRSQVLESLRTGMEQTNRGFHLLTISLLHKAQTYMQQNLSQCSRPVPEQGTLLIFDSKERLLTRSSVDIGWREILLQFTGPIVMLLAHHSTRTDHIGKWRMDNIFQRKHCWPNIPTDLYNTEVRCDNALNVYLTYSTKSATAVSAKQPTWIYLRLYS